jgi:hypothetical protein
MLFVFTVGVLQDLAEQQPADDPQPHPVFFPVKVRHIDLPARKTAPASSAMTITY